MTLEKSHFLPRKRRGLSSVVGALFFTILMIAGFSVMSLALDAQTDIVTTQRIISDIEIKKQQEQFAVFASIDENNILSMNVKNQGQNPVEISSIWIVNKTLSNQPVTRFDINYGVKILSLKNDYLYQRYGIESGDFILSVEDEKVSTSNEVEVLLKKFQNKEYVVLEILTKGGKLGYIRLREN